MGLGNAFTAMTDDVTSIFWNPAGFGFLENVQITMPYGRFTEDRDSTEGALHDFQDTLFSATFPQFFEEYDDSDMIISGDQSIGFIYGMPGFGLGFIERSFASVRPHFIRQNQEETVPGKAVPGYLSYSGLRTSRYTTSFCYGEKEAGYFIGLNANYIEYKGYYKERDITLGTSTDSVSLVDDALSGPNRTDSTWSFDLGLVIFIDQARLGIVAKDINTIKFKLPDERSVTAKPQYRAGFAYPFSNGMIWTLDYDLTPNTLFDSDLEEQNLATGLEMLFWQGQFRVRVGGHKDTHQTGSPLHYTLGAGLIFGFLGLDTAASLNQDDDIWNWSATATIIF